MLNFQLKTPVALIIFRRPDTTQKVFDEIRKVKPPKLFVIADGPRLDKEGEDQACEKTRNIIQQVDWECEILTNYSAVNLGCKNRVSTGLDWVFENVEEAIILEDDCLPHPTFFQFCQELLEKYRHDQRILSISGTNYQLGKRRTEDSYYFSLYPHCWGWATWKRAWQYYDIEMKFWPQLRQTNFLINLLGDRDAVRAWESAFDVSYNNTINNWGFRWTFACWIQYGLNIIPDVNLISNIGFGDHSTHTTEDTIVSNMSSEAMTFPLKHPPYLLRNIQADRFTQLVLYDYHPNLIRKIKNKIKKVLNLPEFG